jgi:IS30 family transposase
MKYKQLTEIERYQIKTMLALNLSKSDIARKLKRHPSIIGREIARNSGLRGYRPQQAQRLAEEHRAAHSHTLIDHSTWEFVERLLRQEWSPEQISGWLKKDKRQPVSPEWIYQYIVNDKLLGGDLYMHLRCQKKRRKRYGKPDARGQGIGDRG